MPSKRVAIVSRKLFCGASSPFPSGIPAARLDVGVGVGALAATLLLGGQRAASGRLPRAAYASAFEQQL